MNVRELCCRIAANDETLTEVNAVHYSQQKISTLLQTLRSTSENQCFHVRELILAESYVTAESLRQLLSFFCRRRRSVGRELGPEDKESQENNEETLMSSLTSLQIYLPNNEMHNNHDAVAMLSLEQNSNEICQQLFQGLTTDQPSGLGDLEELTLENGFLNEFTAQTLGNAFSSPNCQLAYLSLNNYHIDDRHMRCLVSGLMSSNCRLKELHLADNMIGDTGAEQLAQVLCHNALEVVHLSGNRIGDVGTIAIAAALQDQSGQHPTLTEIHLAHNQIGKTGVAALIKAVTNHPTLTEISIFDNPIPSQSFHELIESIPRFRFLKTIHLVSFACAKEWFVQPQEPTGVARQEDFQNVQGRQVDDEQQRHPQVVEEIRDPNQQEIIQPRLVQAERQVHHLDQQQQSVKLITALQHLAAGMEHNRAVQRIGLIRNQNSTAHTSVVLQEWEKYQQTNNEMTKLIPQSWTLHAEITRIRSLETYQVFDAVVVINFFMNLNRLGLRDVLLHQDLIHAGLWPRILAQARQLPSLLFYMLREQPTLLHHFNSDVSSTKKRALLDVHDDPVAKKRRCAHYGGKKRRAHP